VDDVCGAALGQLGGHARVLEKVLPMKKEAIGDKEVEVRAEEHASKKSGGIKRFT
jgi:hypothetical protein